MKAQCSPQISGWCVGRGQWICCGFATALRGSPKPPSVSKPVPQHFTFIWILKLCSANSTVSQQPGKSPEKKKTLGIALLLLSFSERGPGSDLWVPSTQSRERKKELISPAPPVWEKAGAQQRVCVPARAGPGHRMTSGCLPTTKGPWHWHSLTALLRRGQIERKWPLVPLFCRGPCEISVALLFLPSSGSSKNLTMRNHSLLLHHSKNKQWRDFFLERNEEEV